MRRTARPHSTCSRAFIAAAVLLVGCTPAAAAQSSRCDAAADEHCSEIARIAQRPDVVQALRYIEQQNETALRELIALTETPAPPFGEARTLSTSTPSANVIAVRRGTRGGRVVAMAGHLDTVFPEGTDVTVRVRGDTLFAPGVGDDTRGLIVVLHVLRALVQADIRTAADLHFIGTVGEDGLGDLRGVKHLFRPGAQRIDAFIAVDGAADAGITNEALGSRRYRVSFSGPGGHSWARSARATRSMPSAAPGSARWMSRTRGSGAAPR